MSLTVSLRVSWTRCIKLEAVFDGLLALGNGLEGSLEATGNKHMHSVYEGMIALVSNLEADLFGKAITLLIGIEYLR